MISRRNVIKGLMVVGSGVLIGCDPSVLSVPFIRAKKADGVIRAFIQAVAPGAPIREPNITEVFYDEYYGFAKYRKLLVWDLEKRTERLFKGDSFPELSVDRRAQVIQDGLAEKGNMKKLYSGAIYAAQITVFTGFYKKVESCKLIDFTAEFKLGMEVISHPTTYGALNWPSTHNGNYA